MDAVLLGWVVTSHLLAMAVFMVPLGRAADIWGRKRFFTLGMGIFAASSLFCAFPSSGSALIFFRLFQGMASAMIFGTAVALLTSVFPPGEGGGPWGSTSPPSTSASPSAPSWGGSSHLTWGGGAYSW